MVQRLGDAMPNRWPLQSECPAFYGRPDADHNGEPDRAWEDANLMRIVPPWHMYLAWEPTTQIKTIRIHRLCAGSLVSILGTLWAHYGQLQEHVERERMHLFGGTYNFRLMRGATKLSMHSYGCAIDLDPEHNGFGAHQWTMPPSVVAVFKAEGWAWGGDWSKPDPMHLQAARVS